jgi:hypothetical protein
MPNGDGGVGGTASGGATGSGGGISREPEEHRPREVKCGKRPPGAGGIPASSFGDCETDADCTSGFNGRCVQERGMYCSYDDCFADDDCESGAVCLCGDAEGTGNSCSEAGCRVDADCPGSWCSPTFGTCGGYSGVVAYACHTAADECVDDADCDGLWGYCWYSPMAARWVCGTDVCAG